MTSRLGLGLLVVAAVACAHRQEGPAGALQLYGAALGRGDYRAAYALTSTAFQQRTSYEVFAAGFAACSEEVGAQGGGFELGVLDRLLLAPRIVWFYAFKLLWPAQLIFFYPRWVVDARDWTWWLALLALVATLLFLVWLAVARGRRALLAASLIFLATLVPVLGFLNVYPFRFSYVADHFQYLAQVSLLVVAASGLALLAQRSRRTRRTVPPTRGAW